MRIIEFDDEKYMYVLTTLEGLVVYRNIEDDMSVSVDNCIYFHNDTYLGSINIWVGTSKQIPFIDKIEENK